MSGRYSSTYVLAGGLRVKTTIIVPPEVSYDDERELGELAQMSTGRAVSLIESNRAAAARIRERSDAEESALGGDWTEAIQPDPWLEPEKPVEDEDPVAVVDSTTFPVTVVLNMTAGETVDEEAVSRVLDRVSRKLGRRGEGPRIHPTGHTAGGVPI